MSISTCLHCGSPMLAGASTCPSCGAIPNDTAHEPPLPRQVHGSTAKKGWDAYEIPWFDLGLAFGIIRDPTLVPPQSADETMKKYAGRALVLSAIGLVLSLIPMTFFAGILPASVGIIWAVMVIRVGKAVRTRAHRTTATIALGLGLLAFIGALATILVTLAASASST